jgi:hypothetical protein
MNTSLSRSLLLAFSLWLALLEVRNGYHGDKRLAVPSNDNPLAALDTVEQFAEVATRIGNGHG